MQLPSGHNMASFIHPALVLFFLVSFCPWHTGVEASQLNKSAHARGGKGCRYEGHVFRLGAKFRPDPCTRCHCPRRGGPVQCTVQDCAQESHCVRYSNVTKNCCPQCAEYGCRHSSTGRVFQPGEVIRDEPCVRCYCPVGGGNPICDVTSCPMSQCVDPVKVSGVCCPICPHGPNCQIGLLTLPINQSVTVEGAVCTCETFITLEGEKRTMARCNKD